MKKNYIVPEVSVIYVNTADCITSSGIGDNVLDNCVDVSGL